MKGERFDPSKVTTTEKTKNKKVKIKMYTRQITHFLSFMLNEINLYKKIVHVINKYNER